MFDVTGGEILVLIGAAAIVIGTADTFIVGEINLLSVLSLFQPPGLWPTFFICQWNLLLKNVNDNKNYRKVKRKYLNSLGCLVEEQGE